VKLKEEEHIKWAVREVAAAAKTGRNVAVSFFLKKKDSMMITESFFR
jgi:hypothetical protein